MRSRGDVPFILLADGKEVFWSVVRDLDVQSVLDTKNPTETPPAAGLFTFTNVNMFGVQVPVDLVGSFLIFLAIVIFSIHRGIKKVKKRSYYSNIVAKAKYADPFVDFNIEMRDFSKSKNKQINFLQNIDESQKKIFYRIFKEPVSLENMSALEMKLKGLGCEPHEIRSFYVLDEEFKILQEDFKNKKYNNEKINDFLDLAKKTISSLKLKTGDFDDL